MRNQPKLVPACHPDQPYAARFRCERCYDRARKRRALIDLPRITRSADELLDDYALLRSEGYTRLQIAERLGIDVRALDQALYRARRRMDPRAGGHLVAVEAKGAAA